MSKPDSSRIRVRRTLAPRGSREAICSSLAVAALASLAVGCGGADRSQARVAPPVPVKVGVVERRTMPLAFRAIGNVEPIETVAVKARIGGELQKTLFREGQAVTLGETLFVIDQRPYAAALAQAEAILARDQALLAKAEADVARYAELVTKDFVTKEQYDQMVANAASLRATLGADRANVETARLNLEYCTIAAPVSGRTGAISVKVGSLVKANDDEPMVTINRTRPIYVSCPVPAQYLSQVLARRGDGVKLAVAIPDSGGAVEEGMLTFVDNAVDIATSTVLLKGTFPNPAERLWPGQFVDVTVILGEEPGRVVCPAPAVQTGQKGQFVFVVREDRTVEVRTIAVARSDERDAVIDAGLDGGETVVTDGHLRLVAGATVEVGTQAGEGSPRS